MIDGCNCQSEPPAAVTSQISQMMGLQAHLEGVSVQDILKLMQKPQSMVGRDDFLKGLVNEALHTKAPLRSQL